MYQLIFKHYGSDDIDGMVPICIEEDLIKAKYLAYSWMLAYIKSMWKCSNNNIDDNIVIFKFFNEYTFGSEHDISEITVEKLRTIDDLNVLFKKYETDFTIIQNQLFDPVYRLVTKESGIEES